jgi:aspartate kinase
MIVMKFGGTSVGSAERIKAVAEIVAMQKGKKPVVVVSAVGGVTDMLISAAKKALSGVVDASSIEEKHADILEKLNLGKDIISQQLGELKEALALVAKTKDNSSRMIDLVSSFGERISARIVAAHLNSKGVKARSFDAYEIGLLTDSNFGGAEPLPSSYEEIKEALASIEEVPVITGFIAKNEQGDITTLGRGGSDYSAAIIGAAIGAEEIQIWTDVDGIMTSDPKVVKEARTIPRLSFSEAAELAVFGARILHPKTILPAVKKSIPVRVLNSFNPASSGTTILNEVENSNGVVKAIVLKKGITLFNITSTRMLLAYGFLAKLFKVFDKYKVSVDMIATSEVSVSLTIDKSNGDSLLDNLAEELREIGDITIGGGKSIICLVGKGMKNTVGLAGKIFSIMGNNGINIEMISQGASEINIAFIVNDKDAEKAVQCLHKEFFG